MVTEPELFEEQGGFKEDVEDALEEVVEVVKEVELGEPEVPSLLLIRCPEAAKPEEAVVAQPQVIVVVADVAPVETPQAVAPQAEKPQEAAKPQQNNQRRNDGEAQNQNNGRGRGNDRNNNDRNGDRNNGRNDQNRGRNDNRSGNKVVGLGDHTPDFIGLSFEDRDT